MLGTQQMLQISRKMKKDEKAQDIERKFVSKRLGKKMVAKDELRRKLQKCGEQLHHSTFHEYMWDGLHSQSTYYHQSSTLSNFAHFYNEIPCKMLAWLERVGQAAVIKCYQVCAWQMYYYISCWQYSAIGRPSQGRVFKAEVMKLSIKIWERSKIRKKRYF